MKEKKDSFKIKLSKNVLLKNKLLTKYIFLQNFKAFSQTKLWLATSYKIYIFYNLTLHKINYYIFIIII